MFENNSLIARICQAGTGCKDQLHDKKLINSEVAYLKFKMDTYYNTQIAS